MSDKELNEMLRDVIDSLMELSPSYKNSYKLAVKLNEILDDEKLENVHAALCLATTKYFLRIPVATRTDLLIEYIYKLSAVFNLEWPPNIYETKKITNFSDLDNLDFPQNEINDIRVEAGKVDCSATEIIEQFGSTDKWFRLNVFATLLARQMQAWPDNRKEEVMKGMLDTIYQSVTHNPIPHDAKITISAHSIETNVH